MLILEEAKLKEENYLSWREGKWGMGNSEW
jgi:hypothetical protein